MRGLAVDREAAPMGKPALPGGRTDERGIALIVVLFVLLILTAIGLTAGSTSLFEQKMAVNALDQNTAFQSAEAGLRAGETFIETMPGLDVGTSACNASAAPCVSIVGSVNGGDFVNGFPWQGIYTYPVPGYTATGPGQVSAAPEFIVEYITNLPDTNSSLGVGVGGVPAGSDFYRVTSRGSGRTVNSHAIVQSVYARRF